MNQQYLPIEVLHNRTSTFLQNRCQSRTLRGYTRIVLRYAACCAHYNMEAFPPTQDTLCLWMAHLTGTCAANTIANYLSAVGDFCKLNAFDYTTPRMSFRVQSSLRGIRILFPHATIRKSPLTITHLQQLHHRINHNNASQVTFYAMITCCFFGLLRLGEVTLREDSRRTLLFKHIGNITTRGVTITLPASKTDPYWGSTEVFLPRLAEVYCPVKCVERMLTFRRESTTQTLFENQQGTPFTRKQFLYYLHALLPEDPLISGHSARAGGATWAASLGLSELEICRMGRWSSDAYRKYLRAHPLLQYIIRINPNNERNTIALY